MAALLPMAPLICATSAASRLISVAAALMPLLTSLLRLSRLVLSWRKRLASVLALSSTFWRSAVADALDESPLTESKKFDHTPATLVEASENSESTRSAMVDSCFSRASSPLPSSSREIASWSATRRISAIRVPLPTVP